MNPSNFKSHEKTKSREELNRLLEFNPLMPGDNKKVTHT